MLRHGSLVAVLLLTSLAALRWSAHPSSATSPTNRARRCPEWRSVTNEATNTSTRVGE